MSAKECTEFEQPTGEMVDANGRPVGSKEAESAPGLDALGMVRGHGIARAAAEGEGIPHPGHAGPVAPEDFAGKAAKAIQAFPEDETAVAQEESAKAAEKQAAREEREGSKPAAKKAAR